MVNKKKSFILFESKAEEETLSTHLGTKSLNLGGKSSEKRNKVEFEFKLRK